MAETVKIIPSVLREQVDAGWKKKALAEHYGLPMTQMTTALRQLGLTIRKFHAPKFEFVEETVEQTEEAVVSEILEEVIPVSEDVAFSPELQGEVADAGHTTMDVVETSEESSVGESSATLDATW